MVSSDEWDSIYISENGTFEKIVTGTLMDLGDGIDSRMKKVKEKKLKKLTEIDRRGKIYVWVSLDVWGSLILSEDIQS